MSHRPTVYGTRHAVSAGHYLAAAAAFSILEAGGNAIDAGCAAGIALGVLQPDLVNVAGVAPIMIRLANGHGGEHRRPRLVAEDAAGRHLHARARRQDPRRRAAHRRPRRARCVDHRAASATARCASPMSRRMRSAMPARASRCIRCSPSRSPRTSTSIGAGSPTPRSSCPAAACRSRGRSSCSPIWRARCNTWPTRTAPPVPTARPGCARRTMRSIAATSHARSSASSSRRAAICRWTTSPSITRRIEPVVRRPWRGHEVITCGPWCQGPALLEALALLERVGIADLPHNSATYLHRIAECVNLAMADREYYFGDPAFVDVPIDHLLDPATIARRAVGGARRPRVRRDAGAARPHQPAASGQPRRAAEGGGGYVVLLRGGSLGQRVQRHAVGWLGQCAGGAGPGHHAVGPRFAEPARSARIPPASRPASGRGSRPIRRWW